MASNYNLQKRQLKDSWALIAFVLLTIVVNTIYFHTVDFNTIRFDTDDYMKLLWIGFCFVIGFFILTTALFYFIPGPIMHISFILSGLMSIVGGCLSNQVYIALMGVFGGIITLLFYFFSARKNIKYCAGVCKSATSIIVRRLHVALPMVLTILLIVPAQTFFAFTALLSIQENTMYFVALAVFQLFWLFFGLLYLLRVHISSIVAIDLFSLDTGLSFGLQCFKNTLYCLGSVFFGALIIAIIQTGRFLAYMEEKANERDSRGSGVEIFKVILRVILRLILAIMYEIINTINEYVFVYMALYGKSYIESIKGAFEVINERNKILLNSLCIQPVIFITSLIGALAFYSILDLTQVQNTSFINEITTMGVFLMIKQYMEMFDAGTKAFLFAYDKEPERIKEKHLKTYQLLDEQINK